MMQLVLCVLVAVASSKYVQTTDCSEDEHCPSGLYCEPELLICRECLHCEDLKREQPKVPTTCIKSVVECGACFEGLVEDHLGEENTGCVLPDTRDEAVLPLYVWVVIVICLFLFTFVVIVLVYMLRNTDIFKIKAFTRTSVEAPCAGTSPSPPPPPPPASAPPPPYNGYYAHASPASPAPPYSTINDEQSWPLVKRAPTPAPPPGEAREAAGSQEARVYNKPAYVRGPHLPSSYETPNDESDHEAPFVPLDEDTMESPWTPNPAQGGNTNAGASALVPASSSEAVAAGAGAGTGAAGDSQALALALRRVPHPDAPPSKMVCLRQDTNNNRSREASGVGDAGDHPAAPSPSFVINVLNVNTVQQRNDITL